MRLIEALYGRPTDRTPIWMMRQAGRHLPEYRRVRERVSFVEAVSTPEIAAELTLQPVERYGMDGAVIFADIMTPLQAMGVEIDFNPGPVLRPHTLDEVALLGDLDPDRIRHVGETIRLVSNGVPSDTAVIGFSGAPFTLLCYLLEGGGSKDFMVARSALRSDPVLGERALGVLADAMHTYLDHQILAGADVVQLFDSWAGVCDRDLFRDLVAPAAARIVAGIDAPSIYFAPGAGHTLDLQPSVGTTAYGVDWRIPIDQAADVLGGRPIQGNLDPAVLLTDPETISSSVVDILRRMEGRGGHVFNLGHGVDPATPPENVAAMVEAVRR